ncbi:SDR family NAD(P)-dependent oxidoreductase [Terracidiphilus gabretensis]|uniref:SDR family NAD(P)-dependent oxidoreductase n=1 Tax=Terracidiphilus gabretensis TaxID=1577687 RepID=UPI00071B37F5|nr:SDR family NAD(P)-dependent oxidoreductase [Terracidiphilus gabretensis]
MLQPPPENPCLAHPKPLAEKTALVTGAAQGVGKGIALALAQAGCTVAINDKEESPLTDQVVSEIRSLGSNAFVVPADIRSSTSIQSLFDHLAQKITKLDILVNNAGTQTWAPFLELEESAWDRDIDTNLKGTFLCTQAAARWMKTTGGGTIINIGSGSSKLPFPRLVSYSVSKAGIAALTTIAATELGRYGIRVNCIAPGAILTERTAQEDPHYEGIWATEAPLGRVGMPKDVGDAVVFLASDQASFISGQTIWVDGAAFSKPNWPYKLD